MHINHLEAGNLFGLRHGFKVCTGMCYLGSYIGEDKYKRECIKDRTETWEKNMCTSRKTTRKFHQEIYAMVVCAIQSEWIFLQCVTKYGGCVCGSREKYSGKFALYLIQKEKITLTHHRSSKYDAVQ